MPFKKIIMLVFFFVVSACSEGVVKISSVEQREGYKVYVDTDLQVKCVKTDSGKSTQGYCMTITEEEAFSPADGWNLVSFKEVADAILIDNDIVYFKFSRWGGVVERKHLTDDANKLLNSY